jgi:3-oxoacyl-(acyl-carrier-protein) synthase
MNLAIRGMSWVTPLGHDVASVWKKLLESEEAIPKTISSPISPRIYPAFFIGETIPTNPRLRRSSAISRFAVAAGLAALNDAGVRPEKDAARIALIFATSNGGVIYTKRFYHDIVASGAQAASPILFPETVFNAPASHLAAILGITGASYTLVGDGAVGILAVQMAADIMHNDSVDYCLVVAAEEIDWLLCDAYRKWRLLRSGLPVEPFRRPPRGMILSEGAGALVMAREGAIIVDRIVAGGTYAKRGAVSGLLRDVYAKLQPEGAGIVVASANGTFIDLAEEQVILQTIPKTLVYTAKPALGEGVAAGALWQVIAAAEALLTHQIPPVLHVPSHSALQIPNRGTEIDRSKHAIVSACGLNQQIAGLRLSQRV